MKPPRAPLETILPIIQEKLSSWEHPVVTDYELGVLTTALLSNLQEPPSASIYKQVIKGLRFFGLILPDKDFEPDTVYHLFGRSKPSPMAVACSVDPLAYVSHLSAMEYHGLTDRFSKILYLTTPPDKEWREQAAARMKRDLGPQTEAYRQAKLPTLKRQPFERVEGMHIELMRRSNRGAFKAIKTAAIRVATVGRTFLDMVREPHNCGGIQHVIDTYREHAHRNLSLIVDEIERNGNPIEKVRAGYLLDEVCQLPHPSIEGWAQNAKRGGSRMLDPQAEYASHYSSKWMLSINVPSLQPSATDEDSL